VHLSAEKQFVRKNRLEMILSDYFSWCSGKKAPFP